MLIDRKQFAEAAAAFQSALELDPNDRKAHIELGSLFLRIRKGAEAEPHFAAVLKANPNDPELVYKLGISLMLQGKLTRPASKCARWSACTRHPSPTGNSARSTSVSATRSRAIESYEAAIAIGPGFAAVRQQPRLAARHQC